MDESTPINYLTKSLQPREEITRSSHLHNALERLVIKGKPTKTEDPLERLLSDKLRTLKATVSALLDEINLRQDLDANVINRIDDEICTKHGEIMQLPKVRPGYDFDLFQEISKQKNQLENMVLDLEKEKRNEHVECWRDLMFLKRYLLSSLKDYWDLTKKRELLEGDLGELNEKEI